MATPEQDKERALLSHFNLAVALYKAGRVDESIAEFQAALAVDPKHAPSHYNLALRLESKGRNAEAVAAFEAFLACANTEEKKLEPSVRARIAALQGGGKVAGATLTMGPVPGAGTMTMGDGAGATAAPATGVTWHPGDVIDGLYEIREVLGEGGFGSVHRVFHRGWGLDLAVKAPLASKVANRRALEGFVQEANAWVGLGLHPHIVTCFFVRVMDVPRIFIEFMPGGSLADWLAAGRASDPRVALDCAIQISRAMEYVHRKGLVHRDLKPGNCLLLDDGTLKVTDFGLVHVGDADEDPLTPQTPGAKIAKVKAATMTGRLGTPEYMAPEQWTKPREAGKSADVWAFGVMVCELLCGQRPFVMQDGEPVDAFYARILTSQWAHGRPVAPLPEISALIERCLSTDMGRRPPDFSGVTAELEAAYVKMFGHPYPRKAAKEPPILADTLVNQGVSMADLGRTDEALRLFSQALKIDPVHAGATFNEGFLLKKLGKGDGNLVTRLSALSRAQARNWVPTYLLGQAYGLGGESEKATKAWTQAGALSPRNAFIQRASAGVPDLFVAWPKGTEIAHRETTEFRERMDSAKSFQAKGEYERAYAEVKAARAVSGYQNSDEALALSNELGSRGTRVGLAGGWQKVFFEGSGGAREIALLGETLVSRHEDATVKVWDARTGRFLRSEAHGVTPAPRREVKTADRRFQFIGKENGRLEVRESSTGKVVMETEGHRGAIHAVVLSADDDAVYTAGSDAVRRWELDWEYRLEGKRIAGGIANFHLRSGRTYGTFSILIVILGIIFSCMLILYGIERDIFGVWAGAGGFLCYALIALSEIQTYAWEDDGVVGRNGLGRKLKILDSEVLWIGMRWMPLGWLEIRSKDSSLLIGLNLHFSFPGNVLAAEGVLERELRRLEAAGNRTVAVREFAWYENLVRFLPPFAAILAVLVLQIVCLNISQSGVKPVGQGAESNSKKSIERQNGNLAQERQAKLEMEGFAKALLDDGASRGGVAGQARVELGMDLWKMAQAGRAVDVLPTARRAMSAIAALDAGRYEGAEVELKSARKMPGGEVALNLLKEVEAAGREETQTRRGLSFPTSEKILRQAEVRPRVSETRQRREMQRRIGRRGGIEWVLIPGGTFMMGTDDSRFKGSGPRHRVTVPGFQLARTEVTVSQYAECVGAGSCTSPATGKFCNWGANERENHPVNCVDWSQAKAFSEWVGGRLPSEAEWEYAARGAGRPVMYPWGDEKASCRRAVLSEGGTGCGRNSTWPVCSKTEGITKQGVCDMAGNVWEWTQDSNHDSYRGAPNDARAWEDSRSFGRMLRGGSWRDPFCPVVSRIGVGSNSDDDFVGFRVAR